MGLLPFAPNDFKVFFTLFPKCFSSFVHTTCSLSVLVLLFSLRRSTPAALHSTIKLRDSWSPQGSATSTHAYRSYGTFALLGHTVRCGSSDCVIKVSPFGPCTTIPQLPVPSAADSSLGSSLFTRRYSGNHGCFLVLRLLICLSSAGFPASQRWLDLSIYIISGSSVDSSLSLTTISLEREMVM